MKAQMVNGVRYIEGKPHRRGCFAIKAATPGTQEHRWNRWDSPWCWLRPVEVNLERGLEFRAREGCARLNRDGEPWLVFRCNESECPATVSVSVFDLMRVVPRGSTRCGPVQPARKGGAK